MTALTIIFCVAAITVIALIVATYYTKETEIKSACTGDCNQGRNCHCIDQEKLRLEDEFNNSNWPFPVKKP